MLNFFLVFLIGLVVAVLLGFPVLALCKRFHLSQTILHYVDKHSAKAGTPTMGGWIFILASIGVSLFFIGWDEPASLLVLVATLCYGFLGFLDDFIKVKYHKNEGLKPYQKIIGQVGLALVVALFVYFKVGSSIDFFGIRLDLGFFVIPFIVFFFVAVTNAVNLTDGLDGLAGGVSGVYLVFFALILIVIGGFEDYALIGLAMAGALVGFLLFNGFPAKIFMGDTGSLAIGGMIAAIAAVSGLELIMPIIGIMFVLSVISDILQVAYYKKTKKRIFKMAPLHHHFEKLGVHENRIVAIYIVITLVLGAACLLGYLGVTGVL